MPSVANSRATPCSDDASYLRTSALERIAPAPFYAVRTAALYRDCCTQSGVEPLADDEARELARRFHDLLAPAFEREFRLH